MSELYGSHWEEYIMTTSDKEQYKVKFKIKDGHLH